jgi:hypothetical protein
MNLEKTGLFDDAIRDWRKRPEVDKNIAQLDNRLQVGRRRAPTKTNNQTSRLPSISRQHSGAQHQHCPISSTSSDPNSQQQQQQQHQRDVYCWSHGAGRNRNHTSITYHNLAPGHRTEATICNMLGRGAT